MIKYWVQTPPFLAFLKFAYALNPIPSVVSFAIFLFVRYYSHLRYPELKEFEAYYVQKVEINDTLDKVQLTWALPKQPKVFKVPVVRFKQIHYLKH